MVSLQYYVRTHAPASRSAVLDVMYVLRTYERVQSATPARLHISAGLAFTLYAYGATYEEYI